MEGTLIPPPIALIALGLGLIGLAADAHVSARRGRPGLAARVLAALGLGARPHPATEMGRIAHRFEAGFELLAGIAALICGIAIL